MHGKLINVFTGACNGIFYCISEFFIFFLMWLLICYVLLIQKLLFNCAIVILSTFYNRNKKKTWMNLLNFVYLHLKTKTWKLLYLITKNKQNKMKVIIVVFYNQKPKHESCLLLCFINKNIKHEICCCILCKLNC